ncbi:uncharacterized protein LOC119176356 [Rhipicephalus microplus]|uniref:uncharacterized protein LOC119176356 n=1 Tax=Rhipicephalus microplus TaxID=6941 RepID=UPI003F6B7979
MYALVRFLNSFDQKEYVVPVHNIKGFHPVNKDDFNKTKVYTTLWIDEDPDITGSYTCRILLLADSEEELHKQRSNKRLPRPVINASDIEHEEELIDLDLQQPAANSTLTAKEAHKKLKQSQAASKSAAYESILSQHASSALEKNKAARESQSSSKRHEITGHNQKKLKKYTWQEPYEKALRERNELRQTVAAMNERLDSMDCKLSMIVEMLQGGNVWQPRETLTSKSASQLRGTLASESAPPPKKAQQTQQSPADFPETERREVQAEKSHPAPTATSLASCVDTSTGSLQSQCKPSGEPLPTADSKATDVPFTEIGGGKYHVKNGLVIGSQQAEKILGHKKPSLVVKDMAQAIWGREGLAERSYGGKLAPKDYKNPTAVVRKQLSPDKVALIIDTVTHWGSPSQKYSMGPTGKFPFKINGCWTSRIFATH